MYYSGNSLNNNSVVLNPNNSLNLFKLSKGIYKFDYQISGDLNDHLDLTVTKGSIDVFVNNQWQNITDTLQFQNIQSVSRLRTENLQHIKLRVNKESSFSFGVVDDGLINNPTASLNLGHRFDFDLGDKRAKAWSVGKIDKLTGANWSNGKVDNLTAPQIGIEENIGGDDVTDWVKFSLKKGATINLTTDGAIVEIVNYKNQVVFGSDDSYESNLNGFLKAGTYFLHYSSESSMVETFYSQATFSFDSPSVIPNSNMHV
jgi:hypothetical protein